MLSGRALRRAVVLGMVAVTLVVGVSACSDAEGDRSPGAPAPMVQVGRRRFSLTWEGDGVCVHGAYPALPACLPIDVRSAEAVLSALLQPLDPAADLLLVVTRPDVALGGLGPAVGRAVVASASGDHQVAVSVALPAARTPRVCASVDGGQGRVALVVHRAVAVPAGGVAEGAGDGC